MAMFSSNKTTTTKDSKDNSAIKTGGNVIKTGGVKNNPFLQSNKIIK